MSIESLKPLSWCRRSESPSQFLARGERRTVHDEVQAANSRSIAANTLVDLRIVGDVARQDQRIGAARRKLADVLLEPFTLIRHGEPRARCGSRLRDRPRNRTLVGNADDETCLVREICHGVADLHLDAAADLQLRIRQTAVLFWILPAASADETSGIAFCRRPAAGRTEIPAVHRRGPDCPGRPDPAWRDPAKRDPPWARLPFVCRPGRCRHGGAISSGIAAAEVAVAAALSNRELRQPALLLLTFDPRQLRADKRPMHGAFLDLRGRGFVFFPAAIDWFSIGGADAAPLVSVDGRRLLVDTCPCA